nr:lipoxygenase 5 [Tulipa gesneriana]
MTSAGNLKPKNGFEVEGTVVLMQKEALEFNDRSAPSTIGDVTPFLGTSVSLQVVSATVGDPNNGNKGKVSDPAYLQEYVSVLKLLSAGEFKFKVKFHWDESYGIPGAIIVKSLTMNHFLLKTITIDDFPGKGRIHFVCDSWVYPAINYSYDRIFFSNITYLPKDTPGPLKPYREEELKNLRGDDVTRPLLEWDRVYNYSTYNDLGTPEVSGLARPVLGGNPEYPYPRRGRTNRPASLIDPNSETRPQSRENFYVPRDERFGHMKQSDFQEYTIKAVIKMLLPLLEALFVGTRNEFESLESMMRLYAGGMELPDIPLADEIEDRIPFDLLSGIVNVNSAGKRILKLSMPAVINVDRTAWRTDEEFGRETLAGVNPVIISRLQQFPPASTLDPAKYGDQTSTISTNHIKDKLDGLTIDQALMAKRLYIVDHHDSMLPYLNRINNTYNKVYATRALFFLRDDSTLKPLAIELSLPHPQGEQYGAVSSVILPAETGVDGAVWQLAKAYVGVNDSGVHQLISHWLNTHASMEPFVIATNRHLSAVHPIYKLLYPHYRDTMTINALARQSLINARGIIETTFSPAKYSMELSAVVYKNWNFAEQGLPADLLKRGVAVEDQSSPNKIRLLIKDYPYAVDGLAIWSAIEKWVVDYTTIYYPDDAAVQADVELQAWWKEVREVGHGDHKGATWWPKMQTVSELAHSCTTIIWVASALHAAVNFGQYPYAGYNPNRPTLSRLFLPEAGSKEYEELKTNPDKVFLRTITAQIQTVIALSVIEILSTHASDEIYLGQRPAEEWTTDKKAIDASKRFVDELAIIEAKIKEMNADVSFKNRNGPVKMPYTLLSPTSPQGLTMRGIPNSISI